MPAGNGEGDGRLYRLSDRTLHGMSTRTSLLEEGEEGDVVSLKIPQKPDKTKEVNHHEELSAFLAKWRTAFEKMNLPGGFTPLEPEIEYDSPIGLHYGGHRHAIDAEAGMHDEIDLSTALAHSSPLMRSLIAKGLVPSEMTFVFKSPDVKARLVRLVRQHLADLRDDICIQGNNDDSDEYVAPFQALDAKSAVRCLIQLDHCATHATLDGATQELMITLSNHDFTSDPLRVHAFACLTLFLGERTSMVIHPDDGVTHLYFDQEGRAVPSFMIADTKYCEELFQLLLGELDSVSSGWGLN